MAIQVDLEGLVLFLYFKVAGGIASVSSSVFARQNYCRDAGFSNCLMTPSMHNLVPPLGGNSLKVCKKSPTKACAGTSMKTRFSGGA